MKDTIPHVYSLFVIVEIHLRHSSTSWPQPWSRGQASAYNWRNTPSELCDFHSQSQGRCWYFRTALETLSAQREWSASRAKEIFWVRIWQWISTSNSFDNPGFDIMIATVSWRQMHKTIVFCLNFARQLQTNNEQTRTQNRPTRWQLAGEVDPHGPSQTPGVYGVVWVRAAPSGLRFWLTVVDHRTNDSSSVWGVCETYYISTRCEPLYPKCIRISSNKNMNMTPYSPIHRRQHHFVDCQRTRMTQMTKDFDKRHNENYVEWNGISIKSHQFVTNCPYQKHNICSYEFSLRFHDSFAGRLHNQIRTTWLWKIDT